MFFKKKLSLRLAGELIEIGVYLGEKAGSHLWDSFLPESGSPNSPQPTAVDLLVWGGWVPTGEMVRPQAGGGWGALGPTFAGRVKGLLGVTIGSISEQDPPDPGFSAHRNLLNATTQQHSCS